MSVAACEPAGHTVTLALLGDLMVGRDVHPTAASLAYLTPSLKAADLSLANLESPLTPSPAHTTVESVYDLCASASQAALFPIWGLDMLTLANNHSLDCGEDGVGDTIRAVSGAGLVPVGPGAIPVYREVNGLKLAFLAFDDVLSAIDKAVASQLIREARASGAVVIVAVHWGAEYQHGPTDRQEYLARQFSGAGAALIVGTHPHVLQRAEWIRSFTTAGVQPGLPLGTLVLYSLGNALFDQHGLAGTRQSALVMVTLDEQGVKSTRIVPFALRVVESRIIAPDGETVNIIRDQLKLP